MNRLGVGAPLQRIGTEGRDHPVHLVRVDDAADDRTAQVPGRRRAFESKPYHPGRRGGRRRLPAELSDQSEVDVKHVARVEPGEQMLAVRIDPFDHVLVEQPGTLCEPSLRRRHGDLVPAEVTTLVSCQSVKGVAFGQRLSPAGGGTR